MKKTPYILVFFLFSFFISTQNSCLGQNNISISNIVKSNHSSIELSKEFIIKSTLNESKVILKENIDTNIKLCDLNEKNFLYISDLQCYSCTEWIFEQLICSKNLLKNKKLNVIYFASNLGNYYSLKQRYDYMNFKFYYVDNIPTSINEINKAFFFIKKNDKIEKVYIPIENQKTFRVFITELQ